MKKSKWFSNAMFSVETFKLAIQSFKDVVQVEGVVPSENYSVTIENENWDYKEFHEFAADYRKNPRNARVVIYINTGNQIDIQFKGDYTYIAIAAPTRPDIERIFDVFESAYPTSLMPIQQEKDKKISIFIGHGRSFAWRDLKDHLQDKHHYNVIAYETGARAGHTIRDILEDMIKKSTFAILVMTAEDEQSDGSKRCRQNVVHEIGLFQGRLGFSKAIMLLENGVEEFSNVQGIQYIPFTQGSIKETYGEVLATIKREFTEDDA